jgi:hypothetical protein
MLTRWRLVVLACATGCQALTGLDEYESGEPKGGAAGAAGATTTSSSSSSQATGGGAGGSSDGGNSGGGGCVGPTGSKALECCMARCNYCGNPGTSSGSSSAGGGGTCGGSVEQCWQWCEKQDFYEDCICAGRGCPPGAMPSCCVGACK